MKAARLLPACLFLFACTAISGCCVPAWQVSQCRSQNMALQQQARAQLAEIERLRAHSRDTAERLIRTEEELALLEEQIGLDRTQLQNYQQERAELHEQVQGLIAGRAGVPAAVRQQLAGLSQRYPALQFDPLTGIAKLDTDVLFDSGKVDLKPGAEQMVAELVRVLKSEEARGLKVMVVGHTDNRRIAKRPGRDRYPNNFHLSTARALAVADLMRQEGFADYRLGVAGFGPHQPVAPNVTPKDRQKNRRVEIFVVNRDVPVVGWTESIPTVY